MANPSRLEKIQITGNSNSATATKVNVQEANGEVNTQTINTGFNKNIGLGGSDVVGANTLLNQYATTPVDWTATAFNSGQVVFYGGKQWIAKIATVAGDVPSVSSKWEEITFEALANKTVTVDQTIIDGSTNAVAGNAVFDALATKAPISSVHNPVTLGTPNGLSLSNQQLSLGLASSGVTGALSGTDWNTFNGKFNTPTGLTTNYLPKWNGSGFGNSIWQEFAGGRLSNTGNDDLTNKLQVDGSGKFSGIMNAKSYKADFNNSTANFIAEFDNLDNEVTKTKILYNAVDQPPGGGVNHNLFTKWNNDYGTILSIATYGGGGQDLFIKSKYGGTWSNWNKIVKANTDGTISASPATTANQVPTWGQVQAVASSSGSYTPTVSASTNCVSPGALPSTYTKNGNTVTLRLNVLATNFTAANTFTTITVNLPVNRTLTDVKNIGSGSGFNAFGEYWAAIAQTGANNNTVSVSFRTPSTNTGNITLFVQYDITQ